MATEVATPPVAVQLQRVLNFPGARHLGLMLVGATMIAVMIAGYLWSQAPDYKVLYGNLSDRDGGGVIAALQTMNVPYKFADGGALLVPANQVHEVKLRLAGQGLPKGGLVGFEVMEGQKFGTSQFAEQINYQRALEGELARSIQSLSAVQSARVHLALTKPSAFLREQPKPSASVLLNLYPGRTLDPTQVGAVVHLVSNSVPDLRPKSVSVVDQNGNPLSTESAAGRGSLDPNQIKFRQDVEQSYIARIESILAPLTGNNNVRAQVTADLDFSATEHAEEIYKPNQNPDAAAIRSQQTSESANGGANGTGGVPGALSNQPPGTATAPITTPPGATAAPAAPVAPGTATGNSHRDATTNYEVDKTIRHIRQEPGRVKRLAVAVVVNHRKRVDSAGKVTFAPLAEAEITQITNLVREVMAFDKERGDSLSVMNSRFTAPEQEKIVELPLWKQPEMIDLAKTIGKNTLIGALLLFVVLGVLRPMLKTLTVRPQTRDEDLSEGVKAGEVPRLPEPNSYEQHVERAKNIARDDPKVVANVVKDWVSSDGK